jgi:hypothetical protein
VSGPLEGGLDIAAGPLHPVANVARHVGMELWRFRRQRCLGPSHGWQRLVLDLNLAGGVLGR